MKIDGKGLPHNQQLSIDCIYKQKKNARAVDETFGLVYGPGFFIFWNTKDFLFQRFEETKRHSYAPHITSYLLNKSKSVSQ